MSSAPATRLSTLGGVRCETESGESHSVTAQPRRVGLLLYLGLAQPRGFHSRDQLLALFWPDHDEQRARNALSQAVHFLRRALGPDAIVSGADDQLRLDPGLVWFDVIAFESAFTFPPRPRSSIAGLTVNAGGSVDCMPAHCRPWLGSGNP